MVKQNSQQVTETELGELDEAAGLVKKVSNKLVEVQMSEKERFESFAVKLN